MTLSRIIYTALLAAAVVMAAFGCAAGSAVPMPIKPSAAESVPAASAAEATLCIDMYRPELFKDSDTSQFHYSFLQSSCLVIPIDFPCKDREIQLKVSAGFIAAARKGAMSAYDSDRFKELRYIIGQEYVYIGWYPLESEEDHTFTDHAVIAFTVYEDGEPKARGEIEAVKTSERLARDIDYTLTLTSLELCP